MPKLKTRYYQTIALVIVIGLAVITLGSQRTSFSYSPWDDRDDAKETVAEAIPPASAFASRDTEFFSVRQDMRRCMSPLCGGYFVKRVNQPWTRCANGRRMRECYVAEIDWNGQPEVESGKAILSGGIIPRRFARFGNLGALRVSQSWQSSSNRPATGTLYLVRDRGVRCITHPCLSHSAWKLNSALTVNIAGVDLAAGGAGGELISEGAAAMTEPRGVIVDGYFAPVTGPGGRAQTLKATKLYLPAGTQIGGQPPGGPPPGAKRCFKTGCSSQVCADRDVVTTCEFRPEYACYQKAICERQRSGECGFTQTAELTECLRRARR